MTVSELDRWRTAQMLIDQHGENAGMTAAQHADAAIERGDPAGERLWMDVLNKVKALQNRTSGGPLN